MSVHGDGPLVRNPGGGGGTATWKGIILIKDTFDSWQSIDPGDSAACSFDVVPYDNGVFLSAGSHTYGPITVPAGCAAVVPTGLGGLYRVSSLMAVGIPADAGGYSFSTSIQKNGVIWYTSTQTSVNVDGIGYMAPITPVLLALEEGDVIWQSLNNISTGATITVISQSWLLVEYLMPFEEDET